MAISVRPARNDLVGLAGPALLARESDERLVALVHDGDENAFAAIVGRYRAPLERVCRRTLPAVRAEDALQQAFASAYVALSRGVQPAALRPWLTTIAHNAAINALRDRQSESLEVVRELGDDEVPHDIVTRRESLRSVMRAVVDLPARQRQVIVRQEFGGDSQQQIAGELGLTIGAVRQLAHRARCSIRAAAAALMPAPLWQRLPWLSGPFDGTQLVAGSALAVAAKTAAAILAAGAAGAASAVGAAGGAVELTAARVPVAVAHAPAKSAPQHRAAARPAGAARVPASSGEAARATTGRRSTAGRPHRARPHAPTAERDSSFGLAPSTVAPAALPAAASPPVGAPAPEPTQHADDEQGTTGSEPEPGHSNHKGHGGSGQGRGGASSGAAAVSGSGSLDAGASSAPAADAEHAAEVQDEPEPAPEIEDEVKAHPDSSGSRSGPSSPDPPPGPNS